MIYYLKPYGLEARHMCPHFNFCSLHIPANQLPNIILWPIPILFLFLIPSFVKYYYYDFPLLRKLYKQRLCAGKRIHT